MPWPWMVGTLAGSPRRKSPNREKVSSVPLSPQHSAYIAWAAARLMPPPSVHPRRRRGQSYAKRSVQNAQHRLRGLFVQEALARPSAPGGEHSLGILEQREEPPTVGRARLPSMGSPWVPAGFPGDHQKTPGDPRVFRRGSPAGTMGSQGRAESFSRERHLLPGSKELAQRDPK